MSRDLKALPSRLLVDDMGQDQVEYALLTVVVGLAGVASTDLIEDATFNVCGNRVGATNNLWESPEPGS